MPWDSFNVSGSKIDPDRMHALGLIQCYSRSLQGDLSRLRSMHKNMQKKMQTFEGPYAPEARLIQTVCMPWDSFDVSAEARRET